MTKKISQLTQATQVKSDDVTVIVQDGETKKLPLNMMVTKQDIENKKVAGLAKLDEIEATYENDTYTPTITVKNKSSVKVGEGDEVDYSANVMDGHVKSAILKGNTLVNSWKKHNTYSPGNFTFHDDGFMELNNPALYFDHIQTDSSLLKPNTKYLLIIEAKNNTIPVETYFHPDSRSVFSGVERTVLFAPKENGVRKAILTSNSDFSTTTDDLRWGVYISFAQANMSENERGTISVRQMLIEYQDGIENWDIPYFTGMTSVKMPVLTTTGKNLFDINSMSNINNWDTVVSNEIPYCSYKINLKPNTTYTFSQKQFVNTENVYASFGLEKGGFEYLLAITHPNAQYPTTLTLTTDDRGLIYVKLYKANTTLETFISKLSNNQLQLEESSTATSYEPYKSNILTVNEDVTLRGIGDVKDELNLLIGEVVERIGEIVLDGSQTLQPHSIVQGDTLMIKISDPSISFKQNSNLQESWDFSDMICDKELIAETAKWNANEWNEGYNIALISSASSNTYNINSFVLAIRKSYFNVQSIDEFKTWLTQNPLTIQYKLAKESIKTVDLMPSGTHPSTTPCCWKNGHIQLSSSGLLPSLEYSVVTSRAGQINQNATMIVKNDKRIFDLEILLAGGLVNTTYQALTLQNQVETGLSKVSLNSETEPDYLLYHMIMKLIEEKAYKLDDLTEKVSVFYLYEKLSDEQFETIYSALYPFVEDEIVEEPVVEELPEVVEDEVIM